MMYLTVKWLHIVSIISWMAGILYLYRLLIYLRERGSNADIRELLVLMARRLFKYITIPAAVASLVTGITFIVLSPAVAKGGWFHLKFLCVLGLFHFTAKAGLLIGRFERQEQNLPSSTTLRIFNEIPTVLMLIIVAMAVFRPF
jgi:putative membrane protein